MIGQLEMWTAPRRSPAVPAPATHLRHTASPVTACGQKIANGTGYPFVGTQHAPMHIARRGMAVCRMCAAVTTVAPTDESRNP